jgi:thiol:disulfide interchange protein
MKTKILPISLVLCSLFTLTAWPERVQAADAAKSTRPNLYDESADGSKQIADALVIAKREHKHVLLQFGANWCGWCHRLHKLFESDKGIAGKLKNDFVVVLVDVNKEHNKGVVTKYGQPTRFGLPVIVVLDADGKQLTTQDTAKLEEGDHHSPEKVMAFLMEWSPKK